MLNVNVINAKNSQKIEVKPGQPASVKVEPGTRFELADAATGKAPAQIKGRRNGDNLEIVVDEKAQVEEAAASNAQSPDLVLENYYKQEDVSLFAGTGEAAVSYVPVDGAAANAYAAMNTSATTGAALGVFPLLNPVLGAAVIGSGAVLAVNNSVNANKAPVAQDATAEVVENKALSAKVPTATDTDGSITSYKLTKDVSGGKLTFNADGSYSFDANKGFDDLAAGQTRTVSFNYVAVDNQGANSEPKTISITVTGTNDVPVAIAAAKSVDEGAKVDGSVTATDADARATLTYALVGEAPAGLIFNGDGKYTFDANNEAYNSLKAGETQDVVVKFKANDGTVDSAEQTLTITVTGTNDAPVATFQTAQAATEDDVKVLGQLTSSDVDKDAKATYAVDGAEIAGLKINADGSWSFDPKDSAYQSLAQGKTQDVLVKYKVTDDQGVSDTESFTITVTGTNDVPVAAVAKNSADEGKTVTGAVTATDADAGATLTYALVSTAPAGLTFKDDGTYSFNAGDAAYDSLKAGETQDVVVKFKANDGTVDSAEQTLTIKVTGTNDAAKIEGTSTGEVTEDTVNTTATGTLTVSDADAGQAEVTAQSDVAGTFGKFSITEAGKWTYTLDNASIQSLPSDFFLEDKLTVKSLDGSASQDIVITINGADDQGQITFVKNAKADDLSIVKSDESADISSHSAHGTLSVGVLDFNDKIDVSKVKFNAAKSTDVTGTGLTAEDLENAFLSALVLNPIAENGGAHNLSWDFFTDGVLPKGFHLVLDYTLQSLNATEVDADGNTTKFSVVNEQIVQVDVTGVNGAPVLQIVEGDSDKADLTEINAAMNASGSVTLVDADFGDLVTFEVSDVVLNPQVTSFLTAEQFEIIKSQYLSFMTIEAARNLNDSSNLQWTFDSTGDLNTGFIPEGETLALNYTVKVTDSELAETTKVIHINILGTNAAPVIERQEKDTVAASLVETNDMLSASGTLSLTDLDFNDPSTVTCIGVKVVGNGGGFDNGHFLGLLKLAMENDAGGKPLLVGDPNNLRWTFKSSSKDDFDYLAQDETLNLEYTIEAKDSYGATSKRVVSVEITGTNDAPLIFANGTDRSEATVDGAFKASGTLTVVDENILTAKVAGVKLFNEADVSATEIDVQGLKLEDMLQTSGTFAEVNELHNLTWKFVGDASKAKGLASGAYTLAYDIAITDNELTSHQTVNIHFQV